MPPPPDAADRTDTQRALVAGLRHWIGLRAEAIRVALQQRHGVGYGRQTSPYEPGWVTPVCGLACDVCGATWDGCPGEICPWCVTGAQRQLADQRRQLLRPDWARLLDDPRYAELDDDDRAVWRRTRDLPDPDTAATAWARRLRHAVDAGIVTEAEANEALRYVNTASRRGAAA